MAAFLDVARAPVAQQLLAPPATALPVAPASAPQPPASRAASFAASGLAATAGAALAIAGRQRRPRAAGRQLALRASTDSSGTVEVSSERLEAGSAAEPGLQSLTSLRAIPFLPEPAYRRYVRNVPGDAGFDPLGLAGETPDDFVYMLEAELKHGRLAMLAGVGFVMPELLHSRMADLFGLPDLMADYGCVPTTLNGGLQDPMLLGSLLVIFAAIGFADISIPRNTGLPGYYGWDPLNFGDVKFSELARSLLRNDAEWVAEAEAKHGRIAMIAVTYMALREYVTEEPLWPAL